LHWEETDLAFQNDRDQCLAKRMMFLETLERRRLCSFYFVVWTATMIAPENKPLQATTVCI